MASVILWAAASRPEASVQCTGCSVSSRLIDPGSVLLASAQPLSNPVVISQC